jgi:sugar lactone lactonase YvrE
MMPTDDGGAVNVEIVGETRDRLGECPVWDATRRCLYRADVEGRAIHRLDPSTGRTESRPTPGRPGSFALTDDPDALIVAMEHGMWLLTWSTGELTPWLDLESPDLPNRLNDGRCGPSGTFWVGSMHEGGSETTGMLHRITPDGAVSTMATDIMISNGLAFSPDGSRMYFADSPRRTVWSFDVRDGVGDPTTRRLFTDFTGLPGFPDGACVDADGCYWTACVHGSAVARLTPDGRIDQVIDVPVSTPTMPAFGGVDLSTMYVTSIGEGRFSGRQVNARNGALVAIATSFTGLEEPRFPRPRFD